MRKESSIRSILIVHNNSEESKTVIAVANQFRKDKEVIDTIDVTKYKWDEPPLSGLFGGYHLPYLFSPEGIFQGLEDILEYCKRDDKFRRY